MMTSEAFLYQLPVVGRGGEILTLKGLFNFERTFELYNCYGFPRRGDPGGGPAVLQPSHGSSALLKHKCLTGGLGSMHCGRRHVAEPECQYCTCEINEEGGARKPSTS